MQPSFAAIPEWHKVTPQQFQEDIAPRYRPAILRGLVSDWPLVQMARSSATDTLENLHQRDSGSAVDAILLRPESHGRLFYNEAMDGFNFLRKRVTITEVLEQLARYAQFPTPPSVAIQSALIAECLPSLLQNHVMPLLDAEVQPRIWLGNHITTPTHIDGSDNIACVVSGRRQFVLFPPEQIANLYIGPLDFAPTPSPISLVNLRDPDFERFPNYRIALEHAQTAILEPGDAIYIPNLWWHHVESMEKINILINYWWGGSNFSTDNKTSPYGLLLQALLSFKELPPAQKAAWGSIFQHYVFSPKDPAAHIPEHKRGILQR
ncbi:cupin-like domain-containing protein [Undibacterium sp. Di24W]|uniref:cupin-like domain-containing protein n=1 Tax=Undibacterium sp. Di24W TaxID=3413033 RepID=UPI003BF404B0